MSQHMAGKFGLRTYGERAEATDAVISVLDEAVALNLRLRAVAEDLHDGSTISGAMRGVLRELKKIGPQTVPQMARRRPVTRQHIQAIVNDLQRMGYVELVENPAHKRSKMVRLTPEGERTLAEIVARESALLDQIDVPVSPDELESTRRVLATIRETLERNDLRRLAYQTAYGDTCGDGAHQFERKPSPTGTRADW